MYVFMTQLVVHCEAMEQIRLSSGQTQLKAQVE